MFFFFFKQKTAYEMRISDWSSDVCSSDLRLSNDPGAKAIGAVLVENDAPGLSFGPNEQLMGFRGVPSSDLYLDGCEVPLDNIIVPAGGFKQLMEAFDLERCGNATMALGQASGALEDVSDYVQERKQFGKPRSEEHTSELQSLMRISYAVFCLK